MQKTSLLGNSLIWFGAAVSIAEIMTGTLLAPLGFWKAAGAIVLGHAVGSILLFFAGWIGAKYGVAAMEGVKRSFGAKGGILFAVLNVVQLVGWTAVMISAGAQSAHGIWDLAPWVWSCLTGALIFVWIILKTDGLKILNCIAVLLLFVLSSVLSFMIFRGEVNSAEAQKTVLSFGDAMELSIAMPLSWLPLIGDYTCSSARPKIVSALSSGVYFLVSCWMYFIGLGAALFAGTADITQILGKAGLGIPALLIVIISTVTTTYLDVYSSEMSVLSITEKISPHATGFFVCLLGVLLAVFCSTAQFEGFLYWISSVFSPMIAIEICDFLILKKADAHEKAFRFPALAVWGIGFILYRVFLAWNPACGSTLPVMLITAILHIAWQLHRLRRHCQKS